MEIGQYIQTRFFSTRLIASYPLVVVNQQCFFLVGGCGSAQITSRLPFVFLWSKGKHRRTIRLWWAPYPFLCQDQRHEQDWQPRCLPAVCIQHGSSVLSSFSRWVGSQCWPLESSSSRAAADLREGLSARPPCHPDSACHRCPRSARWSLWLYWLD